MYKTELVLAAAPPHLFEQMQPKPWMIQLVFAFIAVAVFDMFADKIPGVKGINRLPQALTLVSLAAAFSSLTDIPLISSLTAKIADLSVQLGTAFSTLYNIGGWVVAAVAAGIYAKRYMGMGKNSVAAERVWPDGIMFGLLILAVATFIPTVAYVLEFFRYSVLTGVSNIVIIIGDVLSGIRFS